MLTDEGIAFCDKLFRIERSLNELAPEERLKKRQELSVPVLEEFKAWLIKYAPLVTPKSALGKAITYCRNHLSTVTVGSSIPLTALPRSKQPMVWHKACPE